MTPDQTSKTSPSIGRARLIQSIIADLDHNVQLGVCRVNEVRRSVPCPVASLLSSPRGGRSILGLRRAGADHDRSKQPFLVYTNLTKLDEFQQRQQRDRNLEPAERLGQ